MCVCLLLPCEGFAVAIIERRLEPAFSIAPRLGGIPGGTPLQSGDRLRSRPSDCQKKFARLDHYITTIKDNLLIPALRESC